MKQFNKIGRNVTYKCKKCGYEFSEIMYSGNIILLIIDSVRLYLKLKFTKCLKCGGELKTIFPFEFEKDDEIKKNN